MKSAERVCISAGLHHFNKSQPSSSITAAGADSLSDVENRRHRPDKLIARLFVALETRQVGNEMFVHFEKSSRFHTFENSRHKISSYATYLRLRPEQSWNPFQQPGTFVHF